MSNSNAAGKFKPSPQSNAPNRGIWDGESKGISMISASLINLKYPLDTNALYWVPQQPSGPALYSPASFYFASADGSRLVPAMSDEERFITALTTEIASLAGFSCLPGLAALLDDLIADNTPAAPIYPQIGDTGVYGFASVYDFGRFLDFASPTAPSWWWPNGDRTAAQAAWAEKYPMWMGQINVQIGGGNPYSTPPARLVENWSNEIGTWRMAFRSSSSVVSGRVRFDIVQGYDFTGAPSCAVARNVVNV